MRSGSPIWPTGCLLEEELLQRHSPRKTVLTDTPGNIEIAVPSTATAALNSRPSKKQQRRLTRVDEIVLALYAKGLTTEEIAARFNELDKAKISPDTINLITDNIGRYGRLSVAAVGAALCRVQRSTRRYTAATNGRRRRYHRKSCRPRPTIITTSHDQSGLQHVAPVRPTRCWWRSAVAAATEYSTSSTQPTT
ncbi:transposase for IS2606 [Mycobacterium haemophilum DSM 44634]